MEVLSPLWKHQETALERIKSCDEFAFFWQMGCGKSRGAIEAWRLKCNTEKRFLRTIILTPPIVVRNWEDEFLKHSKVAQAKITLLTGSGKDRLKAFNKHAYQNDTPQGQIMVTNYESLLMPDLFEAFQKWQPEVLILDESHRVKDQKAERTKKAIRLANGQKNPKTKEWIYFPVKYRFLLSGTPVLNSPMDLFSQFLVLDGGETFSANFFNFRATYFVDKNAGMPRHKYFPNWVIRDTALEEINKKIKAKSMHVTKEQCLDLPPLVKQTIKVGMTKDQAAAYQTMKQDFLAFVKDNQGKDHTATATMALTKALRLQQIASGYVKTVEGREISFEKTPKMAALEELLTELTPHSKVIVWCCWKENYNEIRELLARLRIDYVEVHGETPPNQRFERVDRFKDDPNCRVFMGHPGAGGIGISLVSASYAIFYSRTFSLEHSLQAESRNHRPGCQQWDKITRIDLACEGTLDEIVMKKLLNKEEISSKLLMTDLAEALKK
jgi:SNF2 family DNA or RNA helicase